MSSTPDRPDHPNRLSRLAHRLDPKNWSLPVNAAALGTCIAALAAIGGFYGKEYLLRRDFARFQQAALAGEPPATNPEVDEVLRRTRALLGYLEAMETGPDGILDSVACTPLQLPPDPDLLLDPPASAQAIALAMDCPTLGQGKVSERGAKVQNGPTVKAAGWRMSSGATPPATAILAVDTDGFRIATVGVKAGDTDHSASADCRTGLDGAFDCSVNKGGKTSRVKVAADKGRALLVWIGDLIKVRLGTIEKGGVTTTPKTAEAPSTTGE